LRLALAKPSWVATMIVKLATPTPTAAEGVNSAVMDWD
jgi:hypothetical protein